MLHSIYFFLPATVASNTHFISRGYSYILLSNECVFADQARNGVFIFKKEINMGKKKQESKAKLRRTRPAETPEARENQLISLAYDVAEQRLLDGTATSQEVVHFLRLGSTKSKEELEKLRSENELLRAKTDAIESAKNVELLYKEAIEAMKTYSGADKD